jgi:hypothetical protein
MPMKRVPLIFEIASETLLGLPLPRYDGRTVAIPEMGVELHRTSWPPAGHENPRHSSLVKRISQETIFKNELRTTLHE